ncbi:MAG: class I SAM-dependent methyltransferase [Verrucomicrobiota bacterium]|nr:class I SAM-dependent methyltransferase [Limisphaera sp.]MDW8382988.1 class I SAM-dependent methyltransferase [Verrucomicrobiota bacterium]
MIPEALVDIRDGVVLKTADGNEYWGHLRRLNRFAATFDVFGASSTLRVSEAIPTFTILLQGRKAYEGRAVLQRFIEAEATWTCEAELEEASWVDVLWDHQTLLNGTLTDGFSRFLRHWQEAYQVEPSYKSVVADMFTFFSSLKLWLDQIDMTIRSHKGGDSRGLQVAVAEKAAKNVLPCMDELFARFESACARIPRERLGGHRSYMRRQLHPLTMCSPFAYRTFHKPLGYAGDYEMVNMIVRNGWEGNSLYAMVVNKWFLVQPPAEAHRNRIDFLARRLVEEAVRIAPESRRLKVLNLACGPAQELQKLLISSALSDVLDVLAVDFDAETLGYLQKRLKELMWRHNRSTSITLKQTSVFHLLKESERGKNTLPGAPFDMAYCAGLFDYLSDAVCRSLLRYMYEQLRPGGLLLATNVHPCNPLRNGMEHLLDWHLIHRTGEEMAALARELPPTTETRVWAESTGVNVFLEIRKPAHGS